MASLGEGHEKKTGSSQEDGLLDGDVLTSPTLTNFNERALMNGVVPITVNDYHSSNSNSCPMLMAIVPPHLAAPLLQLQLVLFY